MFSPMKKLCPGMSLSVNKKTTSGNHIFRERKEDELLFIVPNFQLELGQILVLALMSLKMRKK